MIRLLLPVSAALLLAACAGNKTMPRGPAAPAPATASASAATTRDAARSGNWPVKLGKPYQVAGVTYVPVDDRDYREDGIASWYGPGFHAASTANGERYDQDDLTAAHRTLPMPSWLEVENLDNGRRLTVRVNDRGPFVGGRIIDLSRKSAQLLGVDRAGTARVRLRRVYPQGNEAPALAPQAVALAAAVPGAASIAVPGVASIAVPGGGSAGNMPPAAWLVQVAALADGGRAAWLKGFLSSFGPVLTEAAPGGLTRVWLGPYASQAAASAALAQVRAAGYGDARVVPAAPR